MANEKLKRAKRFTGFLVRLRKDARGNTLALAAAALVPLIALVGSGIDLGRLYMAKTHLQQACDAGALAGRKQMGGGIWAQTTAPTPASVANQFFLGNFRTGAYGTNNLSYAYSENSGDVTGVASVNVPMTMMKFFGMPDRLLSVTCDAQMQLPNTDVMFVLDNTGSMACDPSGNNCNSGSTSKIAVLKNAVKCFYESVAQLKTNGTCKNTTSGSGVNSSSQIRFGFVPYTTNVNVGRLLPSSYFADSWPYQSREVASTAWGSWYNISTPCKSMPANTPTHQYQQVLQNGSCKSLQERDGTITWRYFKVTKDITGLKNGSGWNASFTLPLNDDGTNQTIAWKGCIEERKTIQTSGTLNFYPIPAGAYDLDIDTPPNSSDQNTFWGPNLPDVIYTRYTDSTYKTQTTNEVDTTDSNVPNNSSAFCPTQATKMQSWPDPTAYDTYVDSLVASGNTYHDIGLLWGARLMSPTGIFSSENAATKQGGQIQRHMIFMTDGDTQTDNLDYTAYGVAWYDRRQTPTNTAPTDGSGENGMLTQQVNARFAAICTATKNKGITLWVISFGGSGIASTTKSRLQACATDANHYFDATNSTSLNTAFQLIAAQITQLRLTK